MAANNNLYLQEILVEFEGQSYSLNRIVLVSSDSDIRRKTGFVGNVPMKIQRAVNTSLPSLYDDGIVLDSSVGLLKVVKTLNVQI
ncbi:MULTISPECIES: hypothetical protein [unclassified Vibrio]|uniref:hypothetical protein n=1 Tax=unclassified Vibrio TaxID=2614977 RepID=UPI000B8E7DA1|nr:MULTISPECIES: hypothetical protein [unclassified Vibrio]NAW91713.1 hypothetical protein [Vibrio sp. V24_P1S3T111]OXX19172.1 hypothetical protein B9J86_16330 [Vibrio sp. V06_P1A73T115]OXX20496.1 hypothetical protein B9J88_13940 [Vibrio sp. V05_P4A8T149]OXX36315.1 hypothetical protein B9J81_06485 [Vibrio sp. V04_P4A5T148]OXX55134.1 hypothetical protein B9J91_10295 [Vibrio sp. V18_P1S4T112]